MRAGPIAYLVFVSGLASASAMLPSVGRCENVGAAAAVRPASTGTPPGGSTRTLEVGTGIAARERIQTSDSGSLQVMFLDKTTLTVGPNSDLLIDEFVYSAGDSTGQFAASLTKGALRFVGGQISHTAGATITTPAATVGIRGGAALITHDSVCQANQGKSGGHGDCTKVVCMGGTCTVKSRIDARNVQLHISQAVEIGAIGAEQPFSVTSVRLSDNTVTPATDNTQTGNAPATFASQSTVDQTITEQEPEPPPPIAPPPAP